MNKYFIYYYCGSETVAKEVKEFKNKNLAVSYVKGLDDVFEIHDAGSTQVVFKDKVTNIKITDIGPVEVLKS